MAILKLEDGTTYTSIDDIARELVPLNVQLKHCTKCKGGYNINIWQNNTNGELLYRSTSLNGNLSLGRGTSQATEGVRVYKFRNGNYEYWVWDGTLDNPQSGTLEVYKNNRILMQQACTKN